MRDGHVHTPFCPHGSTDSFEQYIERAIHLGYKEISFTEHAPLPLTFSDPTPHQDSAMKLEHMDKYISTLRELKKQYKADITIHIGLEVDFIVGYEEETARFLEEVGPELDDSILSVHFLSCGKQFFCLDYSPNMFAAMVDAFGSITKVYEAYYETVLQSIRADLGRYKPKRIGHMTLVRKFQKQFPCAKEMTNHILHILDEIEKRGYELDYNGAGVHKPLCLQPYPPDWVIYEAMKRNIRIVYGSDAHCANDLHQGIEVMVKEVLFI
ncbi:histidinol-phosphatase HisJ [Thermaerobacillus caldiproteolyticus]|uniref:Histidinol-phosphatase n=1 Tax=Thermaerobacillus caldiproteolyticus TaxID=247480 RepID=A0A7V9Z4K4_9BACL|nr:histidinol-phosphatase HisJ [Anoxybacillus caldiproteolyticus]MBA2873825.1 histidinol-phosphatase (PHP family) [Anoxybacillus caldiproteolyticus]